MKGKLAHGEKILDTTAGQQGRKDGPYEDVADSFHGMGGMRLLVDTVSTNMAPGDAVTFLEKHPVQVMELMLGP